MTSLEEQLDSLPIVPEPSKSYLNPRQLEDYRSQRRQCFEWLLTFGKDPETADGYAFATVKTRGYRMDKFYRWVWEREDGYTAHITTDLADAWLDHLARRDTSAVDKSTHRKAAMMLMKWRHHEQGADEWEPDFTFSTPSAGPRDFLTRDERKAIREAAYEYGSIPAYNTLNAEQRDRWKAYLAQRFEKPKSEVRPADWDRSPDLRITP